MNIKIRILEILSILRHVVHRRFSTNFASLNLTELKHRSMQRMTGFLNFRLSLTWLILRLLRRLRTLLFSRDLVTRWTLCITDLTLARFLQHLCMAVLRFLPAIRIRDVVVDAVVSKEVRYGGRIFSKSCTRSCY